GPKWDYAGITHQTMIDNLIAHQLDVSKLKTFDGSVDAYTDFSHKYELMFIDGEHTDVACFRDFVHGIKHVAPDSIIAFHDTDLIYRAVRICQEYLVASNIRFRFVKVQHSAMSMIFLGKY